MDKGYWMFDLAPQGMEKTYTLEEASPRDSSYEDPAPNNVGELDLLRPQATLLIGRTQEMARLAARLEDAVAGRGGMVLIGGEPRAGKTRLGEEDLVLGQARGMLPLAGHAYEEHGAPFVTSTEIVEQLARAVPPDNLCNVLGPTASSSMAGYGMNCSTARSSTREEKPRSSSNTGEITTTPSDHTARRVIAHRHLRR